MPQSYFLTQRELEIRTNPPDLFGNLPVELFKTKEGYYAFDAHNVRMVTIDRISYDMLSILREREAGVEELVKELSQHPAEDVRDTYKELLSVQEQGFLRRGSFSRTARFADDEERIKKRLNKELAGITISITGKCNLSCSYCIYGGKYVSQRELSGKTMSWETLKNAMIFLADHSTESKEVQLDFFGGEPMIEFKLIEKAVDFIKDRIGDRGTKVDVTISSNGTILNDNILAFLVKHDVYLQFSLDGGKEQHDRNRMFKASNRGSFDKIMDNLAKIYAYNPEYYKRYIRIKAVQTLDQDGSEEKFWENPLLKTVVDEGHFSILQIRPNFDIDKDDDYFEKLEYIGQKALHFCDVETLDDVKKKLNMKEWQFFHSTIAKFFDVQATYNLYMKDKEHIPFTKGCLYGYKEGNVEPSGKITVCHIATNWVIGDVNKGTWDIDKIREYDWRITGWKACSGCFAQRFCDLCPEKIDGKESNYKKSRHSFCQFQRKKFRRIFNYAIGMCEANTGFWNEVDRLIEVGYEREKKKNQDAEAA